MHYKNFKNVNIPGERSRRILLVVHLLQLREISLDPCVAGHHVLGGVENLFSFGAGQQQLVGPLPHAHLKVKLFLHVCVLQQPKNTDKKKLCQNSKHQLCSYNDVLVCVSEEEEEEENEILFKQWLKTNVL